MPEPAALSLAFLDHLGYLPDGSLTRAEVRLLLAELRSLQERLAATEAVAKEIKVRAEVLVEAVKSHGEEWDWWPIEDAIAALCQVLGRFNEPSPE